MINIYNLYSEPQELVGFQKRSLVPKIALERALDDQENLTRQQLQNIAQDPEYAYRYARAVNHGPWPPGEPAISKSPEYAYYYAQYIMSHPWPQRHPATAAIASSARYSYLYAVRLIKRAWPQGEPAIAQSPKYAYYYAIDLDRPWSPNTDVGKQAIATMKSKPRIWLEYEDFFNYHSRFER